MFVISCPFSAFLNADSSLFYYIFEHILVHILHYSTFISAYHLGFNDKIHHYCKYPRINAIDPDNEKSTGISLLVFYWYVKHEEQTTYFWYYTKLLHVQNFSKTRVLLLFRGEKGKKSKHMKNIQRNVSGDFLRL